MDYMTLKEASEQWGIGARMINYYCTKGRIPGAVKMAGVWLVPKDARKPTDRRKGCRSGNDVGGNDESG
jgi:predicted site-specific integrase-resolvase